MSKEVISVGGEQKFVREDTAKAFRSARWALGSIAMFIIVGAIIFFFFFARAVTNKNSETTPANIEQKRQ